MQDFTGFVAVISILIMFNAAVLLEYICYPFAMMCASWHGSCASAMLQRCHADAAAPRWMIRVLALIYKVLCHPGATLC